MRSSPRSQPGVSGVTDVLELSLTLDELRPLLHEAAGEAGVTLDFLMQNWNGRFATYNIGRRSDDTVDPRRSLDGHPRAYKLIGRLKASTREGLVQVRLNPPTSCDPAPTEEDEAAWARFTAALASRLAQTEA
jgi:hypothetical protein